MKIASKLNCILGHNLHQHYQNLSTEQLMTRKKQLKQTYLLTTIMWAVAMLILAWVQVNGELIILFLTSAGGAIIAIDVDYKKRLRIIKNILNQRQ